MPSELFHALVMVGQSDHDASGLLHPVILSLDRELSEKGVRLLTFPLLIRNLKDADTDFENEAKARWGEAVAGHEGFLWERMNDMDELDLPDNLGSIHLLALDNEAMEALICACVKKGNGQCCEGHHPLYLIALSQDVIEDVLPFQKGKDDLKSLVKSRYYMDPIELNLLKKILDSVWEEAV